MWGLEMDDKNPLVTINFKMPKLIRDEFKKKAKEHHRVTMQTILYALTMNYLENIDSIQLKVIMNGGGNE